LIGLEGLLHARRPVAGAMECSATKIRRLETAAQRAIPRDVRDLCNIYGVTDQSEVKESMDLARQGRQPGWWTEYSDLRLSPLIGLEQARGCPHHVVLDVLRSGFASNRGLCPSDYQGHSAKHGANDG